MATLVIDHSETEYTNLTAKGAYKAAWDQTVFDRCNDVPWLWRLSVEAPAPPAANTRRILGNTNLLIGGAHASCGGVSESRQPRQGTGSTVVPN